MSITPQQFKNWIEDCKKNALKEGLTEEDILMEFLEQVRYLCVKQQLKTSPRP